MAETLLKVMIDNLSSLIREEIGLMMGVDKEMKKLSSTLTAIQAVLEDAELKQIESKPIRDWLRKLTALAYEIDDILDDCATHSSKLKQTGSSKLSRYGPNEILSRHKIARRMEDVKEKLDSVAAERAKFHLREMPLDRPGEEGAAASRETSSLLNESSDPIIGRDEDREKIVKMLLDDVQESREMFMSVLPIIGVGGLGKTTLARQVFNDPRVVERFEIRIWICVSDNFEVKTLVKAMIESATRSASHLQHLDALEWSLRELLSQKRYLLVLDDVWNENQEKWFELRDILSCGSTGSSIIVTTRQNNIADIMGSFPDHYQLEGLSDEHCWALLKQRAFRQRGEDGVAPENLEVIGKQIVKKCGGVPLAAKALGGILRYKRKEEEWIYVKESDTWNLPQETLIMPALRLSYHHLPLELRQCFAYFAAFPKDYEIEKEELILLWMAHGYISAKGTLQVEDVGNEMCNELVVRSLFHSADYERISMHDLVHDLAQSVMENKVPGLQIETNITGPSTIRQVNLLDRSVLFPKCFHQDMSISSIFKFKSVRVLDARGTPLEDLPSAIGDLKHLRYLQLAGSKFRSLPNSLCTLWNLQVLILNGCTKLVALPKNMRRLQNLRHLQLSNCHSLLEMPPKFRELTCLKTLSTFVVGLNRDSQLEELQCLDIGGFLIIRKLERITNPLDAKKANIAGKKNLRQLVLIWERNSTVSVLDEDADEKVLEELQPHPNLEYLSIRGFSGRHLPHWMTSSTLEKVVSISIHSCQNCLHLPKLGELPHLEGLRLWELAVEYLIEDDDVESGNPAKIQFPSLKKLQLRDLPNLKGLSKVQEMISEESFPNLTVLQIERCTSLVLQPLSSLQNLEELHCSSSSLDLLSEQDTLTNLSVEIEDTVKYFPFETLVKFTNLQSLTIQGPKEISVTGEGLQAIRNLKSLAIKNCKTMTCLPEGFLKHFTSLEKLDIVGCPELAELPEEIKHLQNLEFIRLYDLAKMTRLPQALQHVSSLRTLYVIKLPQLESLPDCLDKLTSLYTLHLDECEKLASLPPLPNLNHLFVDGCPELETRCQREGEEWDKISHIRRLQIG